jgi:hypothetical protein
MLLIDRCILAGKISSPLLKANGCVGGVKGGELVLYENCAAAPAGALTSGFVHDPEAETIASAGYCVTAYLNGTMHGEEGAPPPRPFPKLAPCSSGDTTQSWGVGKPVKPAASGFLFNVVEDVSRLGGVVYQMDR